VTTTIVFYISGHGFGHASRQVEVLNTLGAQSALVGHPLRFIIRSDVSPALLARTLTVDHELRPGACDSGVVQINSITHDETRTIRQAIAFHESLAALADTEAAALERDDVRLIVADIPPLACEVAHRLNVPSLAIANFTWDWIYEGYPAPLAEAPALVPAIQAAYARATLALRLPFGGGFSAFPVIEDIPLIARHATRSREETRDQFRLPHDRPVALLSFGGYGLPSLDVTRLDCLRDWTVVTADRLLAFDTGAVPTHVRSIDEGAFLDSGFRYEDLLRAADIVVTKPGFGIVAECIAAGTAVLYTSRGRFREYDVFVEEMPRFLRCGFISNADLLEGRWRAALHAVLAQPAPRETLATDGADLAAARIQALLQPRPATL
jgi:L-arabinokinase